MCVSERERAKANSNSSGEQHTQIRRVFELWIQDN